MKLRPLTLLFYFLPAREKMCAQSGTNFGEESGKQARWCVSEFFPFFIFFSSDWATFLGLFLCIKAVVVVTGAITRFSV